jgi:hypothetical protein
MSFHNRPANRQADAQTLRFCRIKRVEKLIKMIRIEARSRVPNLDQDLFWLG